VRDGVVRARSGLARPLESNQLSFTQPEKRVLTLFSQPPALTDRATTFRPSGPDPAVLRPWKAGRTLPSDYYDYCDY